MSDAPTSTSAEPRRFSIRLPRPLWIGVAAVVLVVVVVGLQVGVPIWRQHVAIQEIGRVGRIEEVRPGGPSWLRDILGKEKMAVFDEITSVHLDDSPDLDAVLSKLSCLTGMEDLWLGSTSVTDTGLVHLKGMTKLKRLWLDNTKVTDSGMVHLEGRTSLYGLSLTHTQVTDAGLTRLRGLTKLHWLFLDNTQVTDVGIGRVQRVLPHLKIYR